MKCFQVFFVILFFIFFTLPSLAQSNSAIDSAKNLFFTKPLDEKNYIHTCFYIADNYMDEELYDSAQVWLNKIHEKIPAKKNTLSNYFLITRQAEVYYYNNLQQLGLQESQRGLEMAIALNDSILIADSYNFLGLFYMNIDSVRSSIPYYKKGIPYTRQPPYPDKYLSLSKPHHLYGNLSEAYYKLKIYDSALLNNRISLQKANEIQWQRGIAVAHNSMGDIFLALNNIDSAFTYYQNGILLSKKSKDIDVELLCYSGLAQCFDKKNDFTNAREQLNLGFLLLNEKPMLNRFFALQFLRVAIQISEQHQDNPTLIKALQLKSSIETANVKGNIAQIQTILKAGVANEKRVLNLEIDDARQKQKLANSRLVITLIAFSFLGIGFFVYRYYQNQKLSISKMRHDISQDLHDDIGASLSSLQIYGTIAQEVMQNDPSKAKEMLQKINVQSRHIMENMSDIIWSMKNNNTNSTTLEAKIKNYATVLLSDKNILLDCFIQPEAETALENMNARKNILLIIKEVLNNAAKYSEASTVNLNIRIEDKNWVLTIKDDGKGFNENQIVKGNGIANIKNRCAFLNGSCILNTDNGTQMIMIFPLSSLSDTGW